jgi:WD40 repeat protein
MRPLPLRALIALLLLPVLYGAAHAQSIYIFPPDSSGFPLLRSRIVALGTDGRPMRGLLPSDIVIQENGVPRQVTDLSCPAGTVNDLSAVLAIDVSRSMGKEQQNGTNIDLAKAAATAWVDEMPPGRDECAVVTFDERNYLNIDFTSARPDLMRAIDAIAPAGGTSYDAGFIEPPAGSILAAARGRNRRVVIFLTDGLGGGDEEKIVAAALRNNVTIYCVTLRMPAPAILQNISRRTGGVWFADVSSREEIVAIYRTIMKIAADPLPCEITWRSAPDCRTDRAVTATLPATGATGHTSYTAPAGSVPTISIFPSIVAFGAALQGTPRDTTIVVRAGAMPITITGLTGVNASFAIVGTALPLSLAAHESRFLTLRYTPTDSSFQTASIGFTADVPLCSDGTILCSGGVRKSTDPPPPLKLLAPNGGETLLAGSDTTIAWSGLQPWDTVQLDYSLDGGANWERISTCATRGAFRWHVPHTPGSRCLARVSRMPRNGGLLLLRTSVGAVSGAAFSPDGSRVAVTGSRNDGEMWDAVNGIMVKRMYPHGSAIRSMAWSPDGTMMATAGSDMTAKLWDAGTGKLLLTLKGHTGPILSVCFTQDSRWLATGGADHTVKVWECATGVCLATLPALDDIVRAVACSPDGATVVAAGPDKVAKVWDIRDRVVTASIFLPSGSVAGFSAIGSDPVGFTSIAFSPDGAQILTGANDSTARLWDAHTGSLLRTLHGHRAGVLAVAFSPDGRSVLTGSADGTASLWNARDGELLRTFFAGPPVRAVGFNPAGRRVMAGTIAGDVRIWELDTAALQQDRSDALWSIVASRVTARDADLGQAIVGVPKDSVITSFIINVGRIPTHVRDIRLFGKDAADFSIVSGLPPFDLSVGDSADIELRFAPSAVGPRMALLRIITAGDTIWKSVRGMGLAPSAELGAPVIDFGTVALGGTRDTLVTAVIRNAGSSSLAVTAIRREGPDTAQFSILDAADPFVLEPGKARAMRLRFAPVRPGGTSGRIAFTYAGPAGEMTATAVLFGEGIDYPAPAVAIDRTLGFPAVRCEGSSSPRQVIVRNSGHAPLILSSAKIGGKDAAAFALASPFAPATIGPGDSLAIGILFAPSAIGLHTATLLVESNAPGDSAIAIALSGRRETIITTASTSSIDLGTICPGTSASATMTLDNAGSIGTAMTATIDAPFTIDRALLPLNAAGSATIAVTIPPTSGEGLYTATLRLTDTTCGSVIAVTVRANVAAPAIAAFSPAILAPQGFHADGSMTLTNRSTIDVTITQAASNDPGFAVPAAALPLVIPAGGSRTLPVRFTPTGAGAAHGSIILLATPCNRSILCEVSGTTAPATTVTLPAIEAAPGERVILPITVTGDDRSAAGTVGFTATLRFNASLLMPTGSTPRGIVTGGERRIVIDGERLPGATELARLEFIALLGNADSTPITIESFAWSDSASAPPLLHDGAFTLRNLCITGPTRLVDRGDGAALKAIRPNPASARSTIEFATLETGITRLFVTDMLGRRVATIIDGELPPGAHSVEADLSGLPQGSYFCVLETPTERRSGALQIAR